MADMNQVVLRGRLADDPQIRDVKGGTMKVANFTVCTGNVVKDREITEWTRCSAWNYLADICAGLSKGDQVLVVGRLRTSGWEDADGNKRSRTEVNVETVAGIGTPRAAAPKGPVADDGGEFPFMDRVNGISWPVPNAEGYSTTESSNKELCANWNDSSSPRKGGFMYELVRDETGDNDWQLLGDIPENADMP